MQYASLTLYSGFFPPSELFAFQGTIDKVITVGSIRPVPEAAFVLEIEGEHVSLKGVANPMTVTRRW